jgi:integrase
MASIRKRGQKYEVQVRRSGCTPACKRFHKHADALEWARMMEAKADRSDLPVSSAGLKNITVKDVLVRYRDTVCIKKKSCKTEVYFINALLKTHIASMSLMQVSPAYFYTYREERLKTVKPATVNREFGIYKHAFDVALIEWGVPKFSNPLENIKKLKMNNGRNRRLQKGELKRIEQASSQTKNPYIMPIVYFALETAMRRGEILNIQNHDINYKDRTLHIPITKNGHSRTIPLTARAIEILAAMEVLESNKPFPTTSNAFRLSWERLIARAKIDNLCFHDLLHEAISMFFERGLSIPEVALISGHRSYAMLQRYTHLKAEDIVRKL